LKVKKFFSVSKSGGGVGGNKEAFHHPCSGWRLSGPLLTKEGSLVP